MRLSKKWSCRYNDKRIAIGRVTLQWGDFRAACGVLLLERW